MLGAPALFQRSATTELIKSRAVKRLGLEQVVIAVIHPHEGTNRIQAGSRRYILNTNHDERLFDESDNLEGSVAI